MREMAVDAVLVAATVKIAIFKRVLKKYQFDGCSNSTAINRALEDSIRGVELTEEDYQDIQDKIKKNILKRQQKRKAK